MLKKLLISLAVIVGTAYGQSLQVNTATLDAAMGPYDNQILLSNYFSSSSPLGQVPVANGITLPATGVSSSELYVIDPGSNRGELMQVLGVIGTPRYIVIRGMSGTRQVSHVVGATVLVGGQASFVSVDPQGGCQVIVGSLTVNVSTGAQWQCQGGSWTQINGGSGGSGSQGPKGDKGDPGQAATITVGTTTTGAAGTNASVTNSGTSSAAIFNFTIPKGDKGDTGATGATGATGTAGVSPTLSVGTTTTGAAGTNAAVTDSGSGSNHVLNFTIPRGADGSGGSGGAGFGRFAATASGTSTQTFGTDCSSSTPCIAGDGSKSLPAVTSPYSVSLSTGTGTNDTGYVYYDMAGGEAFTIADSGVVTLACPGSGAGSGCVTASGITGFPEGSIPLYILTIVNNQVTAIQDVRQGLSVAPRIVQGNCAVVTRTISLVTVGFDQTCASGGGSTFNGGSITAPFTISTDGLSTHTPLFTTAITNSGGYNVWQLNDDSGGSMQIGVPGTGNTGNNLGRLYFNDVKYTNAYFAVDDNDVINLYPRSTSYYSMNIHGASSDGALIGIGEGSSHWVFGACSDGTYCVINDSAPGEREFQINPSYNITKVNLLGLGLNVSGLPTCDANRANTIATDTGVSPVKPAFCDGTSWHHFSFSD